MYSHLALSGALAATSAAGCQLLTTEDELERQNQEIDDFVRGIDPLDAQSSRVVKEEGGDPMRDGDYVCRSRPMVETRQYDELVAYDAKSAALWPGALVRGDAAAQGELIQLVHDREPTTFSVSLENLDGSPSATMAEPSLSGYRDAKAELLGAEVTGATPARISADIEKVHSRDQIEIALGASASGTGLPGRLGASFDFRDESVRSRYLVQYTQAYYTMDIDQPRRPSDFFSPAVTAEELDSTWPAGSPPAYVSSVTYGRVILFAFESHYSADELGAALDFAYSGGVDVGGEVSVTYEEMLERSEISAYILGGSGGDAAESLDGFDDLMDFIRSGGDYSADSPGAPIAYKLSYLKDNSPFTMSLTREYEARECERVGQAVQVRLENLEVEDAAGRDELSLYGGVAARGDGARTLLDKGDDSYIRIEEGRSWPEDDTPLGDVILAVEPGEGESIELEADLFHRRSGWFSSDRDLGHEVLELPFEQGWRRDVPVILTGSGKKVRANFSLRPI